MHLPIITENTCNRCFHGSQLIAEEHLNILEGLQSLRRPSHLEEHKSVWRAYYSKVSQLDTLHQMAVSPL
jgi:hypothetical protein